MAAVGVTALAGLAAFGWAGMSSSVRTLSQHDSGWQWLFWLIVCGTVVSLLATRFGATRAAPLDGYRFSEVTILLIVGLISWCLAAMPSQFWVELLTGKAKALALALIIGVVSYAVSRHYWLILNGVKPLETSTVHLTCAVLGTLVRGAVCEPLTNVVGTRTFVVDLQTGCSGVEGIALFVIFFGTYLWICREELRFPQTLALFPIGAVILYFLNVARIVALVLLGSWSGSIAVDGFHSVAGWVLFNAVVLGLVIVSRRSARFSKNGIQSTSIQIAGVPYVLPLLLMIVSSMVGRILFFQFDLLYPLRAIVGAAALWFYRKRISLEHTFSWSAIGIGALVGVFWVLLVSVRDPQARDSMFRGALFKLPAAGAFTWVGFKLIGTVGVAPIAEELAFRGYLIRRLSSVNFESIAPTHFVWFGFLGSSVIFGLLHSHWLAGTLAGMVFALALYRRGSLMDPVIAHITANASIAAYVLMSGHWFVWN